ncbi:acyl-CoA dehydrogenase [Erythrobacter sp. AP23]|nr:acyl-CoA dehydrogenase [Erythrobacter sp. AP23]
MDCDEDDLFEFRDEFAGWLRVNAPGKPAFPLPETFMEVGTDEQFDFLSDWQRSVYEAGYLGVSWPQEYGGRGLPVEFQNAIDLEMIHQNVPIMFNTIGLAWAGPLILDIGSERQKKQYIRRILTAEDVWCQGFSEPGAGSDLANIRTVAVRDGENWRINGSKIWTTLGSYADHMILLAQGDSGAARYKGLNFLLVPMESEGIEVRKIRKMTGEHGFCEVFFNDVFVPKDCLIGQELGGWQVAMRTLTYERGAAGGQASMHTGTRIESSLMIEAATRAEFDGGPALEEPLICDELVRLLIEERANLLHESRKRHSALAGPYPTAIDMSHKLRWTEWNRRLQRLAVELQGLEGSLYLEDPDALDGGAWQRGYLNSFAATIGGGPSEIQSNILAERVLGLPKG